MGAAVAAPTARPIGGWRRAAPAPSPPERHAGQYAQREEEDDGGVDGAAPTGRMLAASL